MSASRDHTLSMVGASHHTASVDLRERLAFPDDQLVPTLARLRTEARECLLLSTCNRTEVYLVGDPGQASIGLLARMRGLEDEELGDGCYSLSEEDAVDHLLRVASGIDSMVLGETQILGQVRDAFEAALQAGTVGRTLGRLLPLALEAGKRARSETAISRGALSPSSVAVELARQTLGQLEANSALVIGAGEAGRAAARSLKAAGIGRMVVTNRSFERAAEVARSVGGDALAYEHLDRGLEQADVVIASTGASEHVVTADLAEAVLTRRPGRPLLCIDIAMPRDIDPAVGRLPGVILHNIDDLEAICSANLSDRAREITAVEGIVAEGVADYREWRAVEPLVPTIGALYQRAEAIRRAEMERTVARLRRLSDEDRDLIDVMTAAIVRRILHAPVAALRARGGHPGAEKLADFARELFALPADDADDGA